MSKEIMSSLRKIMDPADGLWHCAGMNAQARTIRGSDQCRPEEKTICWLNIVASENTAAISYAEFFF